MSNNKNRYAELEAALGTIGVGLKLFDITDSTNNEAKQYASHGAHSPVLFLAEEQSGGRGRLGRSFSSRRGCGIYMSLLCFTDSPLSDIVSVTTAAAVAVALSVEETTKSRMSIKWVNDVYNDRGKVAGILTETVSVSGKNAVIVGIGINIGNESFPDEIKGIASSVGDVSGKENKLIMSTVKRLLSFFASPADRSYMLAYRQRAMMIGEHVELYSCGEILDSGRALGIDDDGGLLFLPDGKSEVTVIRSGEISLKKKQC